MPTLYLIEPEMRLEKEHGRLLVTKDDEVMVRVPIQNVDQVVLVGYAGVTTQALHALLREKVPLFLVSRGGMLLGKLSPAEGYHLELRKAQYRRNDEAGFCLETARQIVMAKVHNQAVLIRRLKRRRLEVKDEELNSFEKAEGEVEECTGMAQLMGIEGNAARAYFAVFQRAFDPAWGFTKRTRRPPRDPVNALLSLGYTLLGTALTAALEIVGLDPYLGYFHQEAYGRPALALDLVEEFRAPVVDSLVLGLINRKLLQKGDFEQQGGGVYLTQKGLRVFLREFSDRLESTVTRRDLDRKLSYRKLFEVQARRMASLITGEAAAYRPFYAR